MSLHDQPEMIYLMPFLEHAASTASVLIEIGCGLGNGSMRAFARGMARSAAPDKLYISVDIDTDKPMEKPDLPYWHIVYGPSEEESAAIAVEPLMAGRKADIIFIDSIHTYEHMKLEHQWFSRFADENTTWIYHDTWIWGPYNPMTDAAKQYAEANGLIYEDVTVLSHGLGMVSKAGHPDWPRPQGVDAECPKL